MEQDHYKYAKIDSKYYIKLAGELRYNWSSGFNAFIEELFKRDDYDDILVDVSDVTYLDSTNIGLVAQIARYVIDNFSHKLSVIIQGNEIKNLLKDMGFAEICNFIPKEDEVNEDLKSINSESKSKNELGRMLLEAHKTLMEINKDNEQKFKNVVEMLERETDQESDEEVESK